MPLILNPAAAEAAPHRRRTDGHPLRAAAGNRLATTLTLAILLHGLLLLGVTFAPGERDSRAAPGLDVLLVADDLPDEARDDSAAYASQRSLKGSGNGGDAATPEAADEPLATPPEAPAAGAAVPNVDPLLATSATRTRIAIRALAGEPGAEGAPPAEPLPPPADPAEVSLRGEPREELHLTPDTQASQLAPWLEGWKRRVERIGTVNYPSAAQRLRLSGSPVIEVTVGSDGQLRRAVVQRTSGFPEIDDSALAILRLASPFEPFPPELAREYRSLRFAYEWQFVGGRLSRSGMSVP